MLEGTRIILFDAVGTIITPRPSFTEVYHAAGQRYGSRRTRQEILERFGDALRAAHRLDDDVPSTSLQRLPTSEAVEYQRWQQIVHHVFDDAASRCDDLFAHLWTHFSDADNWELYPDVAPTLDQLDARRVRWGIASNFDARLERICASSPCLCHAHELFYSSSLGYSKPDYRFFDEVARRLQMAPHEITLIGDDPINDCEGASQAGWKVWQIDRSGASCGDRCLPSLTDILQMLPG